MHTTEQITRLSQLSSSLMTHSTSPTAKLLQLQELIEQADVLKATLVAQAREDGTSWQKIAHAIGGTKQAAQQRYGNTAPRTHDDPMQTTIESQLEDEPTSDLDAPQLEERRVAVIACSGQKLDHPAPARELYTGQLYRSALLAAEAMQERGEVDEVRILSAEHGLIQLHDVLAPYDTTWTDLGHIGTAALRLQLDRIAPSHLVALMPQTYVTQLHKAFLASPNSRGWIQTPLRSCKGIGEQRSILKQLREGTYGSR